MSASHDNKQLGRLLSEIKLNSARRKRLRSLAWLCLLLISGAIVLSLTGCVLPVKQQCDPLPLVLMPVLGQPMPIISYQLSVRKDLSKWAEMLTGTQATPKL